MDRTGDQGECRRLFPRGYSKIVGWGHKGTEKGDQLVGMLWSMFLWVSFGGSTTEQQGFILVCLVCPEGE
ncbi:hypothetical protein [Pasteuria penetrans]|uniref:hypothetical protein n=1 Tax=Pasteuria penetrans TaxID=86005 RepID=UPI000FC30029|nr:hypothetical protein [Pasteuria penetrans]